MKYVRNIEDLKCKLGFENVLNNKVFDRVIVLSQKDGPGTIEGIYDENLRLLVN